MLAIRGPRETFESYHGVPTTWNSPGDLGADVELHARYTVSHLEEGSWVEYYSGPVIYIDVLMPKSGGTCFSGPSRLENPMEHEPLEDPLDTWDYPVPSTNMYAPRPEFSQEPTFTLEATDEAKAEYEQRVKNAKAEIDAAVAQASQGEAAARDGALATLQAMLARPEWQEGCEAQVIRTLIVAGIQKVIDVGAAQASALVGSGPFSGDGGKETFDQAEAVLGTSVKAALGPPDLWECVSPTSVEKGVNDLTLAFFNAAEDLGVPGVKSCNVYDAKIPCDGPTIEAINLGWDLHGKVQLSGLNPVSTDVPSGVAFTLAEPRSPRYRPCSARLRTPCSSQRHTSPTDWTRSAPGWETRNQESCPGLRRIRVSSEGRARQWPQRLPTVGRRQATLSPRCSGPPLPPRADSRWSSTTLFPSQPVVHARFQPHGPLASSMD